MTGSVDSKDKCGFQECGADKVLEKPLTLETFRKMINGKCIN